MLHSPHLRLLVLLGLVVVFIGIGRVLRVEVPLHDDAISLMAATGHLGLYAHAAPVNAWQPAAAWQRFWAPEPTSLRRIGADLAQHDIHPPLYFWILHGWVGSVGVSARAGPALNVALLAFAALALAWSARQAGAPAEAAGAAALLWATSGPTLPLIDEARPYALLALVSAIFLGLLARWLQRRDAGTLAGLALVSLAGLLTHYHAVFLVLAGVLVATPRLWRERDARALVEGVLAGLAVLVLCFVLHPDAAQSFMSRATDMRQYTPSEIPSRLGIVVRSLFALVLPAPLHDGLFALSPLLGAVLGAAAVIGATVFLAQVRRRGTVGGHPFELSGLLFLLVFTTITLAYLGGLSPRHAMGTKYAALATPLLYAALARSFGREARSRRLVLGVAGWMALAALASPAPRQPLDSGAQPVVVDTPGRGWVPPILWHLAPSTPTYVASRSELAGHPPAPPSDGFLYVAVSAPDNHPSDRERLLAAWDAQGFEVVRIAPAPGGSQAFYLTRRAPSTASPLGMPPLSRLYRDR